MRLLFLTAVLFLCGCASTEKDILTEICEANNLFKIYSSKELSFTFNVEKGGKLVKSRTWKWDIANKKIYEDGKEVGKSSAYINDMYWLVFPLMAHETRDQIELTVNKGVHAPYSKVPTTEVVVKYISSMGTTPNDTYKIYVDDKLMVKEWAYFKGSGSAPNRISHWKDYKEINGVKISLNRPGEDDFRLYFTNVSLK